MFLTSTDTFDIKISSQLNSIHGIFMVCYFQILSHIKKTCFYAYFADKDMDTLGI